MTTPTGTPRTEVAIQSWKQWPDRLESVDAVFARELEKENIRLREIINLMSQQTISALDKIIASES
jgi:hypothetical protein